MRSRTWGVLLCGGEARRLGGGDKGALDLGAGPVGRVLLGRLAEVCAGVAVVGRWSSGQVGGREVRRLDDLRPGQGPLGGLEAALDASPHEWVLVVACDLPLVSEALLTALRDQPEDRDVVVAAVAGRRQPLCARYHRRCLPAVSAALDAGRRSMQALVDQLEGHVVTLDELAARGVLPHELLNVNTPADAARAREVLARMVESEGA